MEGNPFIKNLVPPNADLSFVRQALLDYDLRYVEIASEECSGGIYQEPHYRCAGGPALRVILNENTRPWNPFFSPVLHAFLAFDGRHRHVSTVVALQGGDR